jgi:hypothetical protein
VRCAANFVARPLSSGDTGRRPYHSLMARIRSGELGPSARPVVVPDDVDRQQSKARGLVQLPLHIRWSGPPIVYDLAQRGDKARVYEQVLREGTDDDIRLYIDVDDLLDLWDELVLPPPVRRAWSPWFRRHRGIELAC